MNTYQGIPIMEIAEWNHEPFDQAVLFGRTFYVITEDGPRCMDISKIPELPDQYEDRNIPPMYDTDGNTISGVRTVIQVRPSAESSSRLLQRVDCFEDSDEISSALGDVAESMGAADPNRYWIKEAEVHISGAWNLIKEMKMEIIKLRQRAGVKE